MRSSPTKNSEALDTVSYVYFPQWSEHVTRLSVAGRAILSPLIKSLERIAFDDDPLRVLLIETSYQPFISLFSMLNAESDKGQLFGIRTYAHVSRLAGAH